MRNELICPSAAAPEPAALTPAEEDALLAKRWALLSKRAQRYLLGDGTSLPESAAEALLRSMDYVVGQCNLSPRALVTADWDTLFPEGQERLRKKLERGKVLYLAAQNTLPAVENRSLRETLQSIGGFWRRYNPLYFAAEIPCDIDYQLCHPVPETLLGADYVDEYLRRILIENSFLGRFEGPCLSAFLQRSSPDYRELILNLYEPTAAEAIGLVLAEEKVQTLSLSNAGKRKIADEFLQLRHEEALAALRCAAVQLSSVLGMQKGEETGYLSHCAEELYPRIAAALGRLPKSP